MRHPIKPGEPTPEPIPTLIGEITRSGLRLTDALDQLTDSDLEAPSAQQDWTRRNVIPHLAAGVQAYSWLLALARTGTEPGPRPDPARTTADTAELARLI